MTITNPTTTAPHFLRVADLDATALHGLLDESARMKLDPTGEEAERERRRAELAPFRVTAELLARARPDAVFLHCLPAHRGQEVTAEVIDGPQSVVWQQAANRLPTEQAVLATLTGGRLG
jgi:hypothetical protein